ncbi:hypothetical protein BY458DRAFT_535578 [Sporodiniella umbellata]|nr:hypothetical protein BY458DRAFT_535578 [Sporodiniella umbellata]
MSVSQSSLRQQALEPNTHHPLHESFSRRGSLTDPAAFCSRRPSLVADPTLSRRGSSTTDYSSRSPSPFSRRYHEEGYALNRQPSFNKQPMNPLYDPFQRRHSIAEPSRNPATPPKMKAFRFPGSIPETQPHYEPSTSAPPSPPPPIHQGVIRRKASLMAEENYPPTRRASMPLVVSENAESKEMPYSRSPALRVSHKLAERKRRKEMKFLFDDLRDVLPVEKDMKTSKWEILSKAIEYISLLKRRDNDLENEINELRREIESIKRSK